MYIEKLTEKEINAFRENTPLKAKGKIVPFKVFCAGKCYDDPRGRSEHAVFLDDFSCTVTWANQETKEILQKHYVENFMSQLFEDYMENYEKFLNSKKEQTI